MVEQDSRAQARLDDPIFYKQNKGPWFPLKVVDTARHIYRPDVRPLDISQMYTAMDRISVGGINSAWFEEHVRAPNAAILERSSRVAVILDGRNEKSPNEGYIGDKLEATRVIQTLKDSGRNTTIITPHVGTFGDAVDDGINVVDLPAELPHRARYPWHPEMLAYLASQVGPDTPIYFPINGHLPAWIQLDENGNITDDSVPRAIYRALHGGDPEGDQDRMIEPRIMFRNGFHQLQTLQLGLHLLGFDEPASWTEFPPAYLPTNPSARRNARAILTELDDQDMNESGIPLYIHVGVATGRQKVDLKYYPVDQWKKVIDLLKERDLPINSLLFFIPSDQAQAEDVLALSEYARNRWVKTMRIAEADVTARHGWSLATFIHFLQLLSERNALIVGNDSMAAGHAAAATGNHAVVLGNKPFNPAFYSPPNSAHLVMPPHGAKQKQGFYMTRNIPPHHVVRAIEMAVEDILRGS